VDVLRAADRIACEDTRHTGKLLAHLEIVGIPLVSLHEHNEPRRIPELLEAAGRGEAIAVVTDAGMPGISDPGYRLVRACLEAGLDFQVLPGPSAVLHALVGSGLPVHCFHFHGFLPVKKGKRLTQLGLALEAPGTSIFFESPHRITSTLELLATHHPTAACCVARELSKRYETFHRGPAPELLAHFQHHPAKGEMVLLLHQPG
jgi:16S rRNA (cytidine1402-2'-O)-methyltransferase